MDKICIPSITFSRGSGCCNRRGARPLHRKWGWPAAAKDARREGGLFAGLPRDVRWAMLAAVAVVLLSLYEEWPTVAILLGLAFAGFIVARVVGSD